jgi:hypothetical protein
MVGGAARRGCVCEPQCQPMAVMVGLVAASLVPNIYYLGVAVSVSPAGWPVVAAALLVTVVVVGWWL